MTRVTDLLNPILLLAALRMSLSGLADALKSERDFQQELVLTVAGFIAAFRPTDSERERGTWIGSLAVIVARTESKTLAEIATWPKN
jgi:diacylglycerol kinase